MPRYNTPEELAALAARNRKSSVAGMADAALDKKRANIEDALKKNAASKEKNVIGDSRPGPSRPRIGRPWMSGPLGTPTRPRTSKPSGTGGPPRTPGGFRAAQNSAAANAGGGNPPGLGPRQRIERSVKEVGLEQTKKNVAENAKLTAAAKPYEAMRLARQGKRA